MKIQLLGEHLAHDIRYALRGLARNRMFTLTAVMVIALGIGACTAVFSAVDRILFRSLPYFEDRSLVSVGLTAPIERHEFMLGRQYVDWRDRQKPFAALTSWSGVTDCDLTSEPPARLDCAHVEANFLSVFGVSLFAGRSFTREEDRPNGPRVALISYGLWQGRFGADPKILGQQIPLDGTSTTIIGILPQSFELPTLTPAQVLVPQALDEAAQRTSTQGAVLGAFARLKRGVTMAQAEAQLQPLLSDFMQFVPPQFRKEVKLRIRSVRDRQIENFKTASWLLLGAVLAIMMIVCANVANLLLARSHSRRHERAVRSALGATRLRLMVLAFSDSIILAFFGGITGCALGYGLLRWFISMAPEGIPRLQQAGLDLRVLGFVLLVSFASGIIFGMAPAFERAEPGILAGGHVAGQRRTWFRQALVGGQIAISLVLLSAAGLLLRSLWNLANEPLGMRAERVLTAEIGLNPQLYRDQTQHQAFFEELERRLRGTPGISAVALSDSLPPNAPARSTIRAGILIEGRPKFEKGTGGTVVWRAVTPDYFKALDIPILRGRTFREEDRSAGEHVIILSDLLARQLFPNEDPVGRHMQVNLEPPWLTVIGVAADVKNNGILGSDEPEYYLLRQHVPGYGMGARMPPQATRYASVIVNTTSDPKAIAEWMRLQISSLDPTLPVIIGTMDQRVKKLTQQPKFNTILLGLFAAMGLALAAIGLYGVVSFLVAQRTREIGVRIALGATPAMIARLVLSAAARWTFAGVFAGLLGSFFATRLLRGVLFHVPAEDPWAFSGAAALLLAIAFMAAWLPSRRAAMINPIVALRQE